MPIEDEFDPSEGSPFIKGASTLDPEMAARARSLVPPAAETTQPTRERVSLTPPPPPVVERNSEPENMRLRLTPRGRRLGAAVLAGGVTAAVAVGVTAGANAINAAETEALLSSPTIEAHVQQGDGLQKLIEENVPSVASGERDWRDVADDISQLPQNSEITEPGYVLMPGDTVSIPIYESNK